MQDIVIVGAGGMGREVATLIEDINRVRPTWRLLGFAAATSSAIGNKVGNYSVICSDEQLLTMQVAVVIALGTPTRLREAAVRLRQASQLSFPNLIHPSVAVDRDRISLGEGNVICAGNVFTTDISIGSFNILNIGSIYGHDVCIGDCCVINPGVHLSGCVTIEDDCLVGVGAIVLQNIKVRRSAIVGGGAVVVRNVASLTTVLGNPARCIFSRAK